MSKLTTFLKRFLIFTVFWIIFIMIYGLEDVFGKFVLLPLPIHLLGLFGIYSAFVVLWRTFTFNDCPESAKELQGEIIKAKADLRKKGFKYYQDLHDD